MNIRVLAFAIAICDLALGEGPAKPNVLTPRSYLGKTDAPSILSILGQKQGQSLTATASTTFPSAVCSIPLLEYNVAGFGKKDPMVKPLNSPQTDAGMIKPPVPACKDWTNSKGSVLSFTPQLGEPLHFDGGGANDKRQ